MKQIADHPEVTLTLYTDTQLPFHYWHRYTAEFNFGSTFILPTISHSIS